jgi:hypothetical protein
MWGDGGAEDAALDADTNPFGATRGTGAGKVISIDSADTLSGMMSHTPPAASIARLYCDAIVKETAFFTV